MSTADGLESRGDGAPERFLCNVRVRDARPHVEGWRRAEGVAQRFRVPASERVDGCEFGGAKSQRVDIPECLGVLGGYLLREKRVAPKYLKLARCSRPDVF